MTASTDFVLKRPIVAKAAPEPEQAQFIAVPAEPYGFNMETEQAPQFAMSDERSKNMIASLQAENRALRARADAPRPLGSVDQANVKTLQRLEPKLWRYKDGAQKALGLTSRVQQGPTAQNIEETPIGQHYVYDTPAGKQVDTKQLSMANLGMMSTLQKQIDDLKNRMLTTYEVEQKRKKAALHPTRTSTPEG